MPSGSCHEIAVLALAEVVLFDLAVPLQVLGHRDERDRYAVRTCAVAPGPVPSTTGPDVLAPAGLEAVAQADTVVVPGFAGPVPEAAAAALRAAHARGARMVSICTGAFALAAAGLLDGRAATTHWRDADRLAATHPAVRVDPDVLWADEGDVLTSAGVAAGIDLCLHLLRADHGPVVAAAAARRMVVAPHRDGGQAQFVERPLPPVAADPGLAPTRAWLAEHLERPLTVAAMARHAGCPPRTFARRFVAETGDTPLQWLLARRVEEAQRLLAATDLDVEQVATRAGFGSAAALRVHLRRRARTTPTAYRRAWAAPTPPPPRGGG